jgi:hypothetical protein
MIVQSKFADEGRALPTESMAMESSGMTRYCRVLDTKVTTRCSYPLTVASLLRTIGVHIHVYNAILLILICFPSLAVLENRELNPEAQFLVPDGGIQSTML